MTTERSVGIALIVATGLLWTLYALHVDSPLRAAVAVAYFLVAPGWAVISLLDLAQRWAAALLSVAVSLGIVTITATVLLVMNLWTPGRALAVIGCITVIAAGTRLMIISGSQVPVTSVFAGVERREDGS